jgi:DNA repair ATPase RecN
MRLLKTKISNFQSLKDIEIEHGDLTIISGASDLGKSAICRAIRSLYRNTASPEDVRFGETKLHVEQEFDDNSTVAYERSKTVNRYILNETEFNKVGREIPDAVKEFLKADELILDKDQSLDLAFSQQHDAPFLLADSSTLITKVISSLSGIHYIYSALREAATQSQRLKSQATGLEANIKNLEKYDVYAQESDNLSKDLILIEESANKIGCLEAEILKLRGIQDSLTKLKSRYVDPATQVTQYNKMLGVYHNIDDLQLQIQSYIGYSNKLNTISATNIKEIPDSSIVVGQLNKISELTSEIERLKNLSSRKNKIIDFDIKDLLDRQTKLNSVFSSIQSKEIGYNEVVSLKNKNIDNFNKLMDFRSQTTTLMYTETDLKSKIKVCPTCLRVL